MCATPCGCWGDGPALVGRDWLYKIQLDRHQINMVHGASVLTRYPGVFREGLGP